MSPRTIISVIGGLKKAGIVRVTAKGTTNAYRLNSENISPMGAGNGENISPMGGGNGENISCNGENISPTGGVHIGVEFSEGVRENPACAPVRTRAHAREDCEFGKLTESQVIAAGEKAGVSQDVTRQVFADMKANGGGYFSRGVFVKVTGENLQASIRAMAKCVKPEERAEMPKPKEHTAEEIRNANELCAERCAMFKAGKCSAGVSVLPALSKRPHPPEECSRFQKTNPNQ